MSIRINGTNTAANPGITGTDTDTGLQFGTDEVNIVTGGSTRATVDSSGRVLVGTSTAGAFSNRRVSIATSSGTTALELRSATDGDSRIVFTDSTDSGDAGSYKGQISYNQSSDFMSFNTNGNNERMRLDSSGNLQFNSGYGSVATAYGVRAWCSANLTGSGSINGSGNVSTLGDQGTGRWQFNFATAMPDTNYAAVGMQKPNADVVNITGIHPGTPGPGATWDTYTTGTVAFVYSNASGGLIDPLIGNVVVLR